ncbi:MAG: hypothetical protein ACOYK6_08765, partial [Chthoniobacterales bacterium]
MELPTTEEGMESYRLGRSYSVGESNKSNPYDSAPRERSYNMGDHIDASNSEEFTPRQRLYSRSDVESDLEGIEVIAGTDQSMKSVRTFFSARFRNWTLFRWLPGFHTVAGEPIRELEKVAEPKPIDNITRTNVFQADESTKEEISAKFQTALNEHKPFPTPDSSTEVLGNNELDDQQKRKEQEYLYNFPMKLGDCLDNEAIYEHRK